MHPICRSVCLACAVILSLPAVPGGPSIAAADELRTWTDSTGRFKIEARFVAAADGKVTLKQEDGTELEIELTKLSKADQDFVAAAMKKAAENPFKPRTESPFQARPGARPAGDAAALGRAAQPRTIRAEPSSAAQITLAAPAGAWQVEVPAVEAALSTPMTCPLPRKTDFFEGLKGLAVNPVANKAAIGYVLPGRRSPAMTRVVICDLATGRSSPPASLSTEMSPLALHDNGRQVVMRREEFGFGKLDRLEVWTVADGEVVQETIWTPYEDAGGKDRDVMWAEFLDADHLATSSRAGRVVVWAFPEIEPLYTFTLVDGAVPALSPDRRLIAYSNGSEVGLFDVATRKVAAQQATPEKLQWPYLAFSPSGRRLGCVAHDKVLTWDVASGRLERTIPCPGVPVHGRIDFPDEEFVLANGKYLVDLEHQLKLWTYDGHDQVRSMGGWTYFAVTQGDRNPGALVAARVPHPAARDLLEKSLTQPDLFVFKAGTTVKVDVSGIPDAAQRERVQQALAGRLQAVGCQAAPNGTIDLLATVEGPKEREVSYHFSGTYKIKEYITRVQFVYQGQPVWTASGNNVPFVIHLKRGENIETHLRDRERPEYSFFDRVQLPQLLQKPAAGQGPGRSQTLGQSRVSVSGVN